MAALLMDEVVRDRAQPILPEHVLLAKEQLILHRGTHLDSLAERLREEQPGVLGGEDPVVGLCYVDLT